MGLKLDRLSTADKAPSKFDNSNEKLQLALTDLTDLILPAAVILGGIATAVSLYQSLHYGWYFRLFLHAGLYVTAALILIFHRRLPVIPMFVVFLGLIAIDVFYALYSMGLASIGLMSLTVLCTFAGVFFGLRAGIISVGVGILAVSIIGAGVCTGMITTKLDMVRHLTEPITWIVQIACFVMFVVPLLLTAHFVQQKMVRALKQSKEATEQLQTEMALRQSTEIALQESENKYRNVVEHSLAAFYIVQDDLFRFVNNRFCQLSGYTKEEIIDRLGPLDLVHPDEQEGVLENLKKRLGGEDFGPEYELKAVRKDGQVVFLKILGNFFLYNGRPAVSGTLIDISKENIL
ncbi:MAG: hypothetical protein C0407_12025, partial [Desulfobacca sp.]|nr:hypothetical protein [Desulfobacca sp.]